MMPYENRATAVAQNLVVSRYSPARRVIKALLRLFLSGTGIALIVGWASPLMCAEDLHLMLVGQGALAQRLREGAIRNKDRKEAMIRLFQSVGCDVRIQPVEGASANVICDSPGEMDDTIVVGGHLDFIDAGQGIVDDWSGASMLASLYEALKAQPSKHSFKFVAFAAEESGLHGSHRYVENLKKSGDPLPEAFVNLECLGMAPPKVWASRADRVLLRNLIEVSYALHIRLEGVSVDKVGDDDSHSFLKRKVPVITIHSLTQQNLHILHSSQDRFDAINLADYYDAYRLAAFYLKHLDDELAFSTNVPRS